MFKKGEYKIVLTGIALSAILLFAFGLSKNFDLRYLYLPQAWFFVSAVPIILALFLGGYIRKGSFAGLEFEVSSEKVAKFIIPATADVIATVPGVLKGSFHDLKQLNRDQRSSIRILKFEQVWAEEYREEIIFEYFDALLNLAYFQIDREGRPSQYLSIKALKSFCFPRQENDIFAQDREGVIGRPTSTERFLWALRDDRIFAEFGRFASELKVSADQDLEAILRKMYSENVEFAAVFSTDQTFIGIVEARSIEQQISKSYIKQKK